MSKVFEVLVKQQLLNFCLAEQAIPGSQFGFLPGRSTTWQLLFVIDDWQRALDAWHAVHALLLDVAKAFDRVDHAIFLGKCRFLGISGSSMDWIELYLSARVIVTSVDDGQLSSHQSISSGVPQGSVLGPPLLSAVFLLPSSCCSSLHAYAIRRRHVGLQHQLKDSQGISDYILLL